jgi:hypothetical protein
MSVPDKTERNAAIIKMRLGGASYQEIGDSLSVSRQRVQQLLWRLEKQGKCPPLGGRSLRVHGASGVGWCEECGAAFKRRPCIERVYCSLNCFGSARTKWERAEAVVRARFSGEKWNTIKKRMGVDLPALHKSAFMWCRKKNITDISVLRQIWPWGSKFVDRLKGQNTGSSPNSPAILSPNSTLDHAGPAPTGPADCNGARRHG